MKSFGHNNIDDIRRGLSCGIAANKAALQLLRDRMPAGLIVPLPKRMPPELRRMLRGNTPDLPPLIIQIPQGENVPPTVDMAALRKFVAVIQEDSRGIAQLTQLVDDAIPMQQQIYDGMAVSNIYCPPHLREPNMIDPAVAANMQGGDKPTSRSEALADPIPEPISLAERAEAGRAKAKQDGTVQDFTGIDERDNFLFLGVRGMDEFWFYPLERKHPVCYTTKDLSNEACRMVLADILWWEKTFLGDKGMNKTYAVNWLIRRGTDAGVYDPRRIRGRGAWMDDGKLVYHFGDFLWTDGAKMPVTRIKSKSIYPIKTSLPAPAETALSDAEGKDLVTLARMFRWTERSSYALLCGWMALAPICGILKWRPHIWITGGVGSGKTTIIEDFMMKLLDEIILQCKGSSTEAGIRQGLESDSRPVIVDESESNEDNDIRRVQNVLSMARQSSSDSKALTLKGTTTGDGQRFNVSSMFCMASVQVGIKQQADHDRIAILTLKPKRDFENTIDDWHKIEARLRDIANDPDIAGRFLRRVIDLAPVTLRNIKVFAEVAARRMGTQREGDQYGTLLAGCWSLMNSRDVTWPEAEAFVDSMDLDPYVRDSEVEESTKVVDAFFSFKLRDQGKEYTVYEISCAAAGIKTEGCNFSESAADVILKRYGMRVMGPEGAVPKQKSLLLANKHQAIHELFEGTSWQADWKGQLERETGIVSNWPKTVKINGRGTRATSIALATILPDSATKDEERPL